MNTIINNAVKTNKKAIIKIGTVFLIAMVVLTFLSRSYQNWTLPKVKTTGVNTGNLSKRIKAKGTIRPKGRLEYYGSSNRTVKAIMVSAGEEVKEEDIIVLLDNQSLEERLDSFKRQLKKMKTIYA